MEYEQNKEENWESYSGCDFEDEYELREIQMD